MQDILTKLSSYNILNYLLPGALFVFGMEKFGGVDISSANVVIDAFVYYFIGMTVSRVGSVWIEPCCKSLNIVKYAPYPDYIDASKKDQTIPILLEQNNVYRSMLAVVLCLVASVGAKLLADKMGMPNEVQGAFLATILFVIYLQAFRKQTEYLRKRVEHHAQNASASSKEAP